MWIFAEIDEDAGAELLRISGEYAWRLVGSAPELADFRANLNQFTVSDNQPFRCQTCKGGTRWRIVNRDLNITTWACGDHLDHILCALHRESDSAQSVVVWIGN